MDRQEVEREASLSLTGLLIDTAGLQVKDVGKDYLASQSIPLER